ncbi:hypothetical protein, partial [Spirosoma arcticum]
KRLKRRRSAVVEPVFGSLLNYFGMPHRRTGRTLGKGKTGAHKRMVMGNGLQSQEVAIGQALA